MTEIEIRDLQESDIEMLVQDLQNGNVHRSQDYFRMCFDGNKNGKRKTFIALIEGQFAGTIHLLFESKYPQFRSRNIPEINDLAVASNWRNKGTGAKLIDKIEAYALSRKFEHIGLGVGLYRDYGIAQRLYVARGYVPDGYGVFYDYKEIDPGSSIILDDDLTLCFTKKLGLNDCL